MGSKEGIAHAPVALVDPGDLVLVPDPGYPVYSIGTELVGGRVSYMPLLAERGWTPDLSEIDPMDRSAAKLMWLNYPNNPTAAAGSEGFFAEALEFCRRNQILLCQDAAYSEVTFDGFRATSALSQPGALDYCVEFHSLSKTYNMTGWRIGWAAGNAAVIEALARVKSNMDSGMFAAIEAAGVAALEMPEEWISRRNKALEARRDRVVAALRRMGLAPEVPAASLYVWTPVPQGFDSSSFAAHVIDEAGVVVTPGLGFGPGGDGYFRISLTTPDARLDEAMDRLARLNF
ncbi:MAG: aminotransferase class I/II-fold pyridoxal phosphate-dependent enzyme [Chloroflexi bacterium]|nr:aminotransferase class I/II-fold pyridoxal phosphate-dependent enzyme [Chloroflexota bacterium]